MALLSFTVRNHRSIRDEVTLDLTRPSLRTLQPRNGRWYDHVFPIAGVFGANATGKSAVLDAFLYAHSAVEASSTTWQASPRMVRAPFLLDDPDGRRSSTYELDFVHSGRRHVYGFEVDADGIVHEWLKDLPSTRWRTLMARLRGASIKLHSSVGSVGTVTDRELVLSRALLLRHPQLEPIARGLVAGFDMVTISDAQREERLRAITEALVDGSMDFADIESLLRVADIGVESVSVQEEKLPEAMRLKLEEVRRVLEPDEEPPASVTGEPTNEESAVFIRNLLFRHQGSSPDRPAFSIHDESDGTVAWLALAVPALERLRKGGLLCVDEIDSSLHPHLLDVVLGAFADPALNPLGAQLIFTSHETYLLSPLSDVDLEPEQVWFTDKTADGATELSCLAVFPRNRDANVAKRYLLGRYGGTPRLAPSSLEALVDSDAS